MQDWRVTALRARSADQVSDQPAGGCRRAEHEQCGRLNGTVSFPDLPSIAFAFPAQAQQ